MYNLYCKKTNLCAFLCGFGLSKYTANEHSIWFLLRKDIKNENKFDAIAFVVIKDIPMKSL